MADPIYWRYKDAAGNDVVTDSINSVPPAARAAAHAFTPRKVPIVHSPSVAPPSEPFVFQPASFGVGALAATLLTVIILRGGMARKIAGAALIACGLAAGGTFYLGYLRKSAGLGDGAFASPTQIVDDAKNAAAAMQTHVQADADAADRASQTDATP